tara:strand:+ start:520 stop:1212 length:693 start_codon:yes stop_codon:yes gene_type:complete
MFSLLALSRLDSIFNNHIAKNKRTTKGVTAMTQHSTINPMHEPDISLSNTPKTRQVRVWDILVRVTHWTVAAGITANLFFTEDGSELHQYVGYTVVGLVVIRLLWGFVGTRYARFSDFFPTPSRIKHHLSDLSIRRTDEQHLGHNPLAAIMMFALWAVIIGLGISGYLMEAKIFGSKDILEEIHGILANSLYLLVPLHIISAIAMSYWERQNLIKSMITGDKTVTTRRPQ